MKKRSVPELLAPAGGFSQLRAAVLNGADAVYMGGSLFNARMRADNFGDEEMKEAVEYAHLRNVKLYVTLNTLVRDDELFKAFSYAHFLYTIGVDGLIIQDLGLGRLIHQYLPDMPMHLSTQATVYNKYALDAVRKLGYSRIVPARELSLEEIRVLAEDCHRIASYVKPEAESIQILKPQAESIEILKPQAESIQIEVFAHGALCMCYSGQCQMSRLIGGVNGRSGNRGMCAQPCRLPYTDDKGRTSYLLSPKDLCTIDYIPQLTEAGVDSLKIEGRLKSAEYVAIVTSIYRKYLDQYAETGTVSVTDEDRRDLAQIFNRGGFTSGYLFGNPGENLLSGSSPKNMGIHVGQVTSSKKGSTLIDISLKNGEDIVIGDGVEIRPGDEAAGHKPAGNVVTYRKKIGKNALRIGDIKERVSLGDRIFKVTSAELYERARKSFDDDFSRKTGVTFDFAGYEGSVPVLTMACGSEKVTVKGDNALEAADRMPASEDHVREQLVKLGGTVYEAKRIRIRIGTNVSIPKSVVNGLRREAVKLMDQSRAGAFKRSRCAATGDVLGKVQACITDEEECFGHVRSVDWNRVALMDYMKSSADTQNDGTIPYIDSVSKGVLDEYIESNFSEIVNAVKHTGIIIGNLGWIERFVRAGVKVFADSGLNIYNSQARKAIEDLGATPACDSYETRQELKDDIPLMITEHPISSRYIVDRMGAKYSITRTQGGDKFVIRINTPKSTK